MKFIIVERFKLALEKGAKVYFKESPEGDYPYVVVEERDHDWGYEKVVSIRWDRENTENHYCVFHKVDCVPKVPSGCNPCGFAEWDECECICRRAEFEETWRKLIEILKGGVK